MGSKKKIVPKEVLDPVSRKDNEEIIYDKNSNSSSVAESDDNSNDEKINNKLKFQQERLSNNNSLGIED